MLPIGPLSTVDACCSADAAGWRPTSDATDVLARSARAGDYFCESNERLPHVLPVVLTNVVDAHRRSSEDVKPSRSSVGPGLRDDRPVSVRLEVVGPARGWNHAHGDVECEAASRFGDQDGAVGGPPPPASTVRPAEPRADNGSCRFSAPPSANVLRTPLAHAGHVTHERVQHVRRRGDSCGDRYVLFGHGGTVTTAGRACQQGAMGGDPPLPGWGAGRLGSGSVLRTSSTIAAVEPAFAEHCRDQCPPTRAADLPRGGWRAARGHSEHNLAGGRRWRCGS